MCLIMVDMWDTCDALIPDDVILTAARRNPDGCGIMWTDGTKLHVSKGLWKPETLLRRYKNIRGKAEGSVVLHVRLATVGPVTRDNCHPFVVAPNLGMCHNGTLDAHNVNAGESDTAAWARRLQAWPNLREGLHVPAVCDALEAYLGTSKVVFLDGDGTVHILNHDLGVIEYGCWLSNGWSWKDRSGGMPLVELPDNWGWEEA